MLDTIAQFAIFFFSASSIWLVGRPGEQRRWGYVLGLCGQPFWLYVTAKSGQWGIFALSIWYTYSWAQGVWFHVLRPHIGTD